MKREVSCIQALDHPNVLKCYDSSINGTAVNGKGSALSVPYLALEYAYGGELFDYLMRTEKFTEEIARFYFIQLIGMFSPNTYTLAMYTNISLL